MEQRGRDVPGWILAGGALLCFAYIAVQVYLSLKAGTEPAFDDCVRHWIYARRTPLLNGFFTAVTYLGNWQTITLLAVVLLAVPGSRKKIGLPFAVTSIASTLLYKLVKSAFQRPRPELAVRLIEQGGWSFPSGHSMNCIVCYGMLIYLIRRYCPNRRLADFLTAALSLLIFLIGFSRIYVGVHFPTDVLAGWSLGLSFLTAAVIIFEKIRGKEKWQ
ncbi:MAG: phosphatase PAP2 family protein [Emergencia sp.]